MATPTDKEIHEEVKTAIFKILSGVQEYSIRDRSYSYADLEDLRKLEEYYRPLAAAEDAGRTGIRVRRVTPVG